MKTYEITIAKEDMKFSSAHFTIFENSAERLHGHNYQLQLRIQAKQLRSGLLIDFNVLKQHARKLCADLDEHLLLPERHPDLVIEESKNQLQLRCRGKEYRLPIEDCKLLPVENVSCECLAEFFCDSLLRLLKMELQEAGVLRLTTIVQESPGQSGRCESQVGG